LRLESAISFGSLRPEDMANLVANQNDGSEISGVDVMA
jgi:hypothetical protein